MGALVFAVLAAAQVGSNHPLTLDEAVDFANQNQPLLRQAHADVAASRARVEQARAPMLPQLSATAGYSRQNGNFVSTTGTTIDGTGTTVAPDPTGNNSFNLGLNFSQLLWDFGQTWNRYRASQANADASQQNEVLRRQQALYAVRSAFFAARASKQLVGVAQETLDNQDRHLEQIQGFVEVGTRPSIDLAQAKTDRANAKVQLINATNGWNSARAQLLQAMGIEQPATFDVSDDTMPPIDEEKAESESLISEATKVRPDILAIAAQMEAQERALGAVRGAYGPSLGFTSSVGEQGRTSLALNWRVGVTLQWNLFSGLATKGAEHEAIANLDSLQAQLDGQRQQVRLETEQARLAVVAAVSALEATQEALDNAKVRLTLAEGRYQTGVGNALELSDAQLQVTNAGAQRVNADYTLASARAQLLKAVGK